MDSHALSTNNHAKGKIMMQPFLNLRLDDTGEGRSTASRRATTSLDVVPLGLAAFGLGVVGLVFGDFALQWQPVPAWLPGRTGLAYIAATALAMAGVAIIPLRTRRAAAVTLASIFTLWLVLLQLPRVVVAPSNFVAWLGVAEIGAIAIGAIMLDFSTAVREIRHGRLAARIAFGCCACIFGASHFVYAQFTASMVPTWLQAPLFWAYFTGTAHAAAGVAFIRGRFVKLASVLLAAMCVGFAVLLHLPRVMAAPTSHAEWAMLFVALCIGAAAWIMRLAVHKISPPLGGGDIYSNSSGATWDRTSNARSCAMSS
jgi:uncharacterized membrane protein YphA (DoxX/SURF4 family)